MKGIIQKGLSCLLSATVMWSTLAFSATGTGGTLEADAASRSVTLSYGSGQEVFAHTLDYYLDDCYSCTYSPQLAHMLVTLAAGAYDQEATTANYEALGFDTRQSYQVGYDEEGTDPDNIGFTIGTKKWDDGTTDCLIVIRGTPPVTSGIQEWLSDLNVGYNATADEGGYHAGFERAANEVMRYVPSATRYVVTGHSRGAAVGNLVEHSLTSSYGGSRVYGYNFAVPDPAYLRGTDFGDYRNIYNISHALDPVSMVPSSVKGATIAGLGELIRRGKLQPVNRYWGKYGYSYWFTDDWNAYYTYKNIDDFEVTNTADIAEFYARCTTYHPAEKYLEYLRNEPDLLQFRIRESLFFPDTTHELTDHLTYTIDGTVTITGCDGMLEHIEIPKKIEGKRVTTIGSSAFSGCAGIKTLTIPDSVVSIGSDAFAGCARIKSFEIPDSISAVSSRMFYGCSSLESVTIPDSITTIGGSAFSHCKSLNNVVLPDSITSIGGSAFNGCESLESIIIPDSVSSIGDSAFHGCTSLENVKLPSDLRSISEGLFDACKSLEEITIPDTVTSIGQYAFYECSSLKGITLPDRLEYVSYQAFYACGAKFKSVTIPAAVKSIGSQAFGYSGSARIGDYVIYGAAGSAAEKYANDNSIKFVANGSTEPPATQPTTEQDTSITTQPPTQPPTERPTTPAPTTQPPTERPTTPAPTTQPPTERPTTQPPTTQPTTEAVTTVPTTTVPSTTQPTITLVKGDINVDGSTDIMDVIIINKFILGIKTLSAIEMRLADFNENGVVDSVDSLELLKYVLL